MTQAVRARWLTAAVLCVVLLVAGVQLANPHSYVSELVNRFGEVGSGADATLTDLGSVDQLKSRFNADAGHPRLVLLFSPT